MNPSFFIAPKPSAILLSQIRTAEGVLGGPIHNMRKVLFEKKLDQVKSTIIDAIVRNKHQYIGLSYLPDHPKWDAEKLLDFPSPVMSFNDDYSVYFSVWTTKDLLAFVPWLKEYAEPAQQHRECDFVPSPVLPRATTSSPVPIPSTSVETRKYEEEQDEPTLPPSTSSKAKGKRAIARRSTLALHDDSGTIFSLDGMDEVNK